MALVIVGLVNKFAIVASFKPEALVSCIKILSPVAGAPPKSVCDVIVLEDNNAALSKPIPKNIMNTVYPFNRTGNLLC